MVVGGGAGRGMILMLGGWVGDWVIKWLGGWVGGWVGGWSRLALDLKISRGPGARGFPQDLKISRRNGEGKDLKSSGVPAKLAHCRKA